MIMFLKALKRLEPVSQKEENRLVSGFIICWQSPYSLKSYFSFLIGIFVNLICHSHTSSFKTNKAIHWFALIEFSAG